MWSKAQRNGSSAVSPEIRREFQRRAEVNNCYFYLVLSCDFVPAPQTECAIRQDSVRAAG